MRHSEYNRFQDLLKEATSINCIFLHYKKFLLKKLDKTQYFRLKYIIFKNST